MGLGGMTECVCLRSAVVADSRCASERPLRRARPRAPRCEPGVRRPPPPGADVTLLPSSTNDSDVYAPCSEAPTETASLMPDTVIGWSASAALPSPSSPLWALPQQTTVPPLRRAQENEFPTVISSASARSWTMTGVFWSLV